MNPALLELGFEGEVDRHTGHSNTMGNDSGKLSGGAFNPLGLGEKAECFLEEIIG